MNALLTAIGTRFVLPSDHKHVLACKCGEEATVVDTSYGYRATCFGCGTRWTWINGDDEWVPEKR